MRARERDGFTLIELLTVMVVISLLAGIAIPNLQRAIMKARAAEALSNLDVIRVGVLQYQADHHAWPPDRNRGRIPPGLEEFLPEGFSFSTDHYVMDYDNWSSKQGFIGLTVITDDEELGQAMLAMLGDNTWSNGKDKFTYVIEWTD